LIETVDEKAGLLEFLRDEESCRNVYAPSMLASGVALAESNLVGPISEARRIRLAVEKVPVLLADEELRVVQRISAGNGNVGVRNRNLRRHGAAQARALGVSQSEIEEPVALYPAIVQRHRSDDFARFSGSEKERAARGRVVGAGAGGPVRA
jgi:hypothetical protein